MKTKLDYQNTLTPLAYNLWQYYLEGICSIQNTKQQHSPYYIHKTENIKQYVDDSQAHSPSRDQANTFQELLNKQDPVIQYAIEFEKGNKSLNFLDINITNTILKSDYQHTYQTNIIKNVFKGFLHKAHSIFSRNISKKKKHF